MNRASVFVIASLFAISPATPAQSNAEAEEIPPLIELARKSSERRDPDAGAYGGAFGFNIRRLRHEVASAGAPAGPECAQHMAARRFARLHADLALAYQMSGEFELAAEFFRNALACRPRDPSLFAHQASMAMFQRDFAEVRRLVEQGLDIDPQHVELNWLAGDLDFLEGRWADAVARYRFVVLAAGSRDEAGRAQLMYWTTQRRAGIATPELVNRRLDDEWPRPLLLFLGGEYSETDLVEAMESAARSWSGNVPSSWIALALFHAGELQLANGDAAAARRYLAAIAYLEHSRNVHLPLALQEIAKLNAQLIGQQADQ